MATREARYWSRPGAPLEGMPGCWAGCWDTAASVKNRTWTNLAAFRTSMSASRLLLLLGTICSELDDRLNSVSRCIFREGPTAAGLLCCPTQHWMTAFNPEVCRP